MAYSGREGYREKYDNAGKNAGRNTGKRSSGNDRSNGYPAKRRNSDEGYGRDQNRSRERTAPYAADSMDNLHVREENPADSTYIEGRNAVLEAFRAGRTIDKLYILDGCQDGPVKSILREAGKQDTIISYVKKERLDQLSNTGAHQGVIAFAAAYAYAEVADILQKARDKGEAPFIFILDGIEDPHNLGAIIRTANLAGAHGVIIPKHRAVGLTAVVAKTSAGALNYTPVAKVTNLTQTMEELKAEGLWFACADMGGDCMYDCNLTGPIGLVIGNEGDGVSRLVREHCDIITSIPMSGDIDSLNASVAAGVLAYEVVRQRRGK